LVNQMNLFSDSLRCYCQLQYNSTIRRVTDSLYLARDKRPVCHRYHRQYEAVGNWSDVWSVTTQRFTL